MRRKEDRFRNPISTISCTDKFFRIAGFLLSDGDGKDFALLKTKIELTLFLQS